MSHLLVAGTAPLRAPLELGEYHTAACTALFHHLLLPHWPEGRDQIFKRLCARQVIRTLGTTRF